MGEVFIGRVLRGGKVTVPVRVRELLNVEAGDYVRLEVLEVLKKSRRKG